MSHRRNIVPVGHYEPAVYPWTVRAVQRPGVSVPLLSTVHNLLLDAGESLHSVVTRIMLFYATDGVLNVLYSSFIVVRMLMGDRERPPEYQMFLTSLLVSWNAVNLTSIIVWCHLTVLEANNCGGFVHRAYNESKVPETKEKLLLFSKQLLTRKLRFTCFGCFSVDAAFFFTLAEIASSYLVVLIQQQHDALTPVPMENMTTITPQVTLTKEDGDAVTSIATSNMSVNTVFWK
ncbi:putative gustatory receptor 28b [Schistocerca cancellata]|uniref:putative gustatory receptor 28b n=1 Tax=Schistocerca cancellata TaxID=274614 RepID=UPI00211919AF|nr:putative gustatory receptor 28b [Schistocerca cancellata]